MGAGQGIIGQVASQATPQGTPQYGLGATGYTPPASAGPRPPSMTSMLYGGRQTGGASQSFDPRMSQPTQPSASWQNPTPFAPWTPRSVSTNANLYNQYGNQNIMQDYGRPFGASDVTDFVKRNMGNYRDTAGTLDYYGISPGDTAKAMGVQQGNLYTAMNRPDYKQYGPNGQFYQPIYQEQYSNYRNPYVGSGGFGGIMGNLGGYGMMGGMGNQGYGQGGIFGGGYPTPQAYPAQGGYGGFSGGFSIPSYTYAEGGEVATDDGIAALLAK